MNKLIKFIFIFIMFVSNGLLHSMELSEEEINLWLIRLNELERKVTIDESNFKQARKKKSSFVKHIDQQEAFCDEKIKQLIMLMYSDCGTSDVRKVLTKFQDSYANLRIKRMQLSSPETTGAVFNDYSRKTEEWGKDDRTTNSLKREVYQAKDMIKYPELYKMRIDYITNQDQLL